MPFDIEELRRLQEELRSADASVRARAVERAREKVDAAVMDVLTCALASENPEVRARALVLVDRLAAQAQACDDADAEKSGGSQREGSSEDR